MSKKKQNADGSTSDDVAEAQTIEAGDVGSVESVFGNAEALPGDLRAFSVMIPKCLLGERVIVAEDELSAYAAYKKIGGVNGHDSQQIVKELPKGSSGYEDAVAAYNAELAKAAQ